jgi:uncharacterized ferredoxin-like protein
MDNSDMERVVRRVAEQMVIAAITAPKARGINNIFTAILDREQIKLVSEHLHKMVSERGFPPFFARDANNILNAQQMVIIGTRIKSNGLPACGLCGYPDCKAKDEHPEQPCAYNTGDLGIAIGSAVSRAADYRVDNRVMFTVGKAIVEMQMLGKEVKIAYGIPLSVSGKNPFFDRL